jgi:Effector-associated domain 11
MTNDIHEKIRQMVQVAELDMAFQHILAVTQEDADHNKFVQLQSQWTEIQALYIQGLLAFDDYFKERNRITFAFLTFLSHLSAPIIRDSKYIKESTSLSENHLTIIIQALEDYANNKLQMPQSQMEKRLYLRTWAKMLDRE